MVRDGERPRETSAASLGGLEEGLAFLLLFSDALLDLVPDPIAVLDDGLVVRNANAAFAAAFGFPSVEAARGSSLAAMPLMNSRAGANARVGDVLRHLFERREMAWEAERIEVVTAAEEPRQWWVRAVAWDTEDPSYRRILFYAREQAPLPIPLPTPAAPMASRPAVSSPPPPDAALATRHGAALARELLEAMPAACLVDPQSCVTLVNHRMIRLFERGDAAALRGSHWLRAFPELGGGEFRSLLDAARDSGARVTGSLDVVSPSGAPLVLEIEVQPLLNFDDEGTELLVLFREAETMMPSTDVPENQAAIPETVAAILDPERLARWPTPPTNRVLVIEADPWTRMSLAELLRGADLDVTLCDSGSLAWERHDPAFFALVVAGLDGDADDVTPFLERMVRDASGVPVLGVTERSLERARLLASGSPLAGFLTGSPSNPSISEVAGVFAHRAAASRPLAAPLAAPSAPSVPSASSAPGPPAPSASSTASASANVAVVVVGAGEADVATIRTLQAAAGIRIRMVYDPDSLSLGLSVARELGIPTVAGGATLSLDPLPDAVIVARPGLEAALSSLGLSTLPRVAREEVALFVADPQSFLIPAPEAPSAPEAVPPRQSDRVAETLSSREPVVRDAWAIAEPAAPSAPATPVVASLVEELSSLTGAFDLLFDFDRLCKRILNLGMSEIGGVSGSLMLLDEEGRFLRIVAAVGLSDLVIQETRQRLGQGIAGRVANEGEPLLLVGAVGDERFPVQGERPEIPSAICVPLASDARVLGVLSVNSNPTGEPFDQTQLRRLTAVGRQVGPALDRAGQLRLVRGRSFEMSLRGAIASIATSSDDIVTRLRAVAVRVTELLHVDSCAIWLHEPGTSRLTLSALGGGTTHARDAVSVSVGTGIVGWVAKHRRPLVVRGVPDDPMDRDVVQVAHVAVPIRHQTDLVGVLALESSSETALDDKRLELIATVASVVGEQIGATRAKANSEHMVTVLSALAELGVAFSSARERPNLGRLVAFTSATILESDVATVRLLREAAPPGATGLDLYEVIAVHGAAAEADDPLIQLEMCVAREILTRRETVTEGDLAERGAATLLTRSNVASLMGIPLLGREGQVLGSVVVYRAVAQQDRDYNYDTQERGIGARLGDYAASAAQQLLRGSHDEDSGARA